MGISPADKARIQENIRDKYRKVAQAPEGLFKFPTGEQGLAGLGYDPELVARLPDPVRRWYCGVGNPFSVGPPSPGDRILDIGCGAGVDTLLAALYAGPQGASVGLEPTREMLDLARLNATRAGIGNVTFLEASAEEIPLPDNSFDLVISNGVFNLVIDKQRALAEALRVLAPGGRFQMADQFLEDDAPANQDPVSSWFR